VIIEAMKPTIIAKDAQFLPNIAINTFMIKSNLNGMFLLKFCFSDHYRSKSMAG
jgi:hypothetical protein